MTDAASAIERSPVRTIVVGVDGSPGANRALAWATARCCENGAELVAVHVMTYSKEFVTDLPPMGMTNWRRQLDQNLRGAWTEAARAAGVPVRPVLREDETPAAGLMAVAADEGADLLVLGTHGHGNLGDRLLGATTYRVAHRAATPVVIIPPDWTPS
jgi:nucleotide-binding universal stress UspA family protein